MNETILLQSKTIVEKVEYQLPYHHYVENDGINFKELGFGLEYINYLSYVIELIKQISNGYSTNILDLGCGDGKLLYELSKLETKYNLLGIDLNQDAIKLAAIVTGLKNVFRKIDINELGDEYSESFDIITAVEVFEHISETDIISVLNKIECLLKKNGKLIICVPSQNRAIQERHYRHYTSEQLEQQLSQFRTDNIHYIHKISGTEKLLRNLLSNRIYNLKKNCFQKHIYNIYRQKTQIAQANNCAHIIGIFSRR